MVTAKWLLTSGEGGNGYGEMVTEKWLPRNGYGEMIRKKWLRSDGYGAMVTEFF